MFNEPEVKLAIVGVSRDCFPITLTRSRLAKVAEECKLAGVKIYACNTIIKNENDTQAALREAADAGANAAVIYLGNFGPEGPTTIFAKKFNGPVMACAAAEESKDSLVNGRGDAYCGMLNASYNFGLRNVNVYIPKNPVGFSAEIAEMIKHFETVAKIIIGVKNLKIFTFGPRPQDFFACNAPIKPLFDMGIEVMENSELDLLVQYNSINEDDPQISAIAKDMAAELGDGNTYPALLPKLARFELALIRFYEQNLGMSNYGIFANKCWPAFEKAFGFVPCYVNSRMASRGIPVACEVDIYGALSEYICQLASSAPVTILDMNNTVPPEMVDCSELDGVSPNDLFMGFHCGNTSSCLLKNPKLNYQLIMNRQLEDPNKEPDITRGTIAGQLQPGSITLFRLQGNAEGKVQSYVCEGDILDVDPRSFGSIGVFAIPEFARFYRHVLISKHFPHHGAVAFNRCGAALFDAVKMLGVDDINLPLPKSMWYPNENPYIKDTVKTFKFSHFEQFTEPAAQLH